MSEDRKKELFQQLRNIAYALSFILGLYGFTVDQSIIDPIVTGVIALFGLITDALSWWYSRKSVTVTARRRADSPVS